MKTATIELSHVLNIFHTARLVDDTGGTIAIETRVTADEALRALDAIIELLELEVMLVCVEREILRGAK